MTTSSPEIEITTPHLLLDTLRRDAETAGEAFADALANYRMALMRIEQQHAHTMQALATGNTARLHTLVETLGTGLRAPGSPPPMPEKAAKV